MSVFEHVAVAISIIFGLGITTLLTASLDLFRHRTEVRFYWVPVAWAAIVFWLHLQVWWALGVVIGDQEWLHSDFLLTVALAISLFCAASLVLPSRTTIDTYDLTRFFQSEGRWGCAAVGVAYVILIPATHVIWGIPLVSPVTLAAGLNAIVAGSIALSRTAHWGRLLTVTALCVQAWFQYLTFVPMLTP